MIIHEATIGDIIYCITNRRPGDLAEAEARGIRVESVRIKDVVGWCSIIADDGTVCGLGYIKGGNTVCFMLTDDVNSHRIEFLKWALSYRRYLKMTLGEIRGDVYTENKQYVRFLEWMGARFSPSPCGDKFKRFTI